MTVSTDPTWISIEIQGPVHKNLSEEAASNEYKMIQADCTLGRDQLRQHNSTKSNMCLKHDNYIQSGHKKYAKYFLLSILLLTLLYVKHSKKTQKLINMNSCITFFPPF